MDVERVAADHASVQVALGKATARAAGDLWGRIDPNAIMPSWLRLLAQLVAVLSGAQRLAAGQADLYVTHALDAQGIDPVEVGRVSPAALAGAASDGRDLPGLLQEPAISTLVDIRKGATAEQALTAGAVRLDMIVRTQVTDAGRVADGVATVARRNVTGYVRMLTPPSCSRCVVLAGRWYRWNAGFLRHPRCDCRHIPAAEAGSEDIRVDPRGYFDGLSEKQQNKIFTEAGAKAIRDGADIARVVNARRGAAGLTPAGARLTADEARALRGGKERGHLRQVDVGGGHQEFVTTELARGRGRRGKRGPRLMPESIYRIAGDDRDEALRLLKLNGYLL